MRVVKKLITSMEINPTLLEIGLNKKEALILETLLGEVELPVAEIAQKTTLKRPTAYAILEELFKKGLVDKYDKNLKTYFRAQHPLKIREFLTNEAAKLKTSEAKLEAILPALISQFNLVQHRPGLHFYEGIEGIKKVYEDTLKQPTTIYALVATEQPHPEIGRWVREVYVKRRLRQKIKAYVIASSALEAAEYQKLDTKELRETIIVPKDQFPFEIEIDIYADSKVAFISYQTKELIGVIMESPAIYKTMKAFFDLAWLGQKQ